METTLLYIFVGAIWFFIGWKAREIHAMRMMNKVIEQVTEDTVDEFRKKVIDIKVESHDGQLFVYKKDDGSYLAHGDNKTTLEDILNEKFPGKLFNASPEDLEKLNAQ